MEMDHISLDGVSCEAQGIILLDADLSNVEIKQQETVLPDKLRAIEAEYTEIEPGDIPMIMVVVGAGELRWGQRQQYFIRPARPPPQLPVTFGMIPTPAL